MSHPFASAAVARLLDAAANRAGEALRVVEDYLRFVLDDAHLCGLAKQLRHDLAAAISALPMNERIAMRDTQQDVGTGIATEAEYRRGDALAVMHANFVRLEESLRSLEEYSKIDAPPLARRLEQLRYRAYTLHKAAGTTAASLPRLAAARLYVLVDGCTYIENFEAKCSALAAAGVHVLQLRDKRLADRELLQRAKILRRITSDGPTLCIINDRPDLAVLAGADGVHVGQEELPVGEARRIAGGRMLVGVSTHNIAQARQAVLDGADYLGVGPTFPSATKSFDALAGLELVRQVAEEIRLPAFAIGGITPENLPQVLAAGMRRVAVSSAVVAAADPAAAARQLLQGINVFEESVGDGDERL